MCLQETSVQNWTLELQFLSLHFYSSTKIKTTAIKITGKLLTVNQLISDDYHLSH